MKFSIGDVFEVTETYNGKLVLSDEEKKLFLKERR